MESKAFHPVVARWFESAFSAPTEAQKRGWPAIRSGAHTLIAAPTGSGKTLAAFLVALDELYSRGLAEGVLPDETVVVYVSPLKALSTDIHLNLAVPLAGIRQGALNDGLTPPPVTTAIRTGDTPSSRRAAMTRKPPHILVTTPESLYLLLTAERSRNMLRTARCVIVDEIHAVLPSRRGSHLALSLERLDHVTGRRLQRIGLSATQRPVECVARFLAGPDPCTIVDLGYRRKMDLALELPSSPLDAVMPHEVWDEIYDRIALLAADHGTTLVFVNARRMAERLARHLAERLGDESVAAHHGSLAQSKRQAAEKALRDGSLKILVATASLELGIDIGSVDLVCQIGSPRSIATFVQRIGRAGHQVDGISKGRLFPITRDDLLECCALLDALDRGELEHVRPLNMPLDVLSQQIVAEASAEEWSLDGLTLLCRRAYPYRNLTRSILDDLVGMLSRGFVTDRGRRGALLYHDAVNGRIKGRKGARLTALTSGGAIPDSADYRVIVEPQQTFVGTVDEDFAVESISGDIFQLGNAAWQIQRIESGTVRVRDAQGAPPTIPFWFGEAPSRSDELSAAVSRLREDAEAHLESRETARAWLGRFSPAAAVQLAEYLCASRHLLGVIPTQRTIVAERFFDASGGMQLIVHAPFGARVNRAWGLALRKKFCRTFNFELQAAATENAVLLSLGPQHSFPLADVFDYLSPDSLRATLTQAVLDAPMFQTRWRWNLNISLAVPRQRGGRKVPPPIQRMQAEDILVAVFPDAAACLENIVGERDVPEHPLVQQTLADCLTLAMDQPQLNAVLGRIRIGSIRCVECDATEPSPLAHEILTASPYAFLDDAPLEERRSQAAYRRRAFEPTSDNILDRRAIDHVIEEVRPKPDDPDQLHDLMLSTGCVKECAGWEAMFRTLVATGRATRGAVKDSGLIFWLPTERLHEGLALWDLTCDPALDPMFESVSREDAATGFVRGVLDTGGPMAQEDVARFLGIDEALARDALLRLEAGGEVLRMANGTWCNRRLLARMHRLTLRKLRAAVEPVSAADFTRFLFAWQKAANGFRGRGLTALSGVIQQMGGYAVQASAWETDVLPLRIGDYDPAMLDTLCYTGRVVWGRATPQTNGESPAPIRSTPIALFFAEDEVTFRRSPTEGSLSSAARRVLDVLEVRGASFMPTIVHVSELLPTQVEAALGELVGRGFVTADGFAGLRVLLTPSDERRRKNSRPRHRRQVPYGMEAAGRWSIVDHSEPEAEEHAENMARTLLLRYGVVFRRLLTREHSMPSWRDLVRVFWRLEARGEMRGGRFVAGFPGEQFALPDAVGLLRRVRKDPSIAAEPSGISGTDPLNLAGILSPGRRIPAIASNRIVYRSGVPVAALVGGEIRMFSDKYKSHELKRALLMQPQTKAVRRDSARTGRRSPRKVPNAS